MQTRQHSAVGVLVRLEFFQGHRTLLELAILKNTHKLTQQNMILATVLNI